MIRLLVGDARVRLLELEDESVQTVVTSPPYFGLRDYGTGTWTGGDADCKHIVSTVRTGAGIAEAGERFKGGGKKASEIRPIMARRRCPRCGAERLDAQIGLEETPEEYVEALVELFRIIRQKLRADGTVWLNLGDTYASSGGLGRGENLLRMGRSHQQRNVRLGRSFGSAKPKDLIGIPWMVAFALRADGWFLRQELIWHKPNPMPESVTDRCTKSHEQLFLLSKSGKPTIWRARDTGEWCSAPDHGELMPNPSRNPKYVARRPMVRRWMAFDYYFDQAAIAEPLADSSVTRLSQDVEGQAGSTRANGGVRTDRPIKAARGRSTYGRHTLGGAMPEGQARAQEAPEGQEWRNRKDYRGGGQPEPEDEDTGLGMRNKRSVWTVSTLPFAEAHFATFPVTLIEPCILAGSPPGGIVLDPFGGSGTTALAADRAQRDSIICELNPEYAEIARKRLAKDAGLLLHLSVEPAPEESAA